MRRIIIAAIAALITGALFAPTAQAHGVCDAAHGHRQAVIKRFGKDTPGRNICRYGVTSKFNKKWSKPATHAAKHRYDRQLRSLLEPPPAHLVRIAVPPGQAPAGTLRSGVAAGGKLARIAACESGGDPTAVDPTGTYRGKYQFDRGTWAEVGGSGDPAAAPEAEQDMRAAMLLERAGPGRWPICGKN